LQGDLMPSHSTLCFGRVRLRDVPLSLLAGGAGKVPFVHFLYIKDYFVKTGSGQT
jgi:hypothetical protein